MSYNITNNGLKIALTWIEKDNGEFYLKALLGT